MNVYKEMYLELFNKVSDVIKELQDIQASVENIYANEKQDRTHVIPIRGKKKSKSGKDSVLDEFSVAMVNDEIDVETISKLEDFLKQKRDELEQ